MKRQSPFTTCYCCDRTRERDYTTLFNMSVSPHLFLIDICDLCLQHAEDEVDYNYDGERECDKCGDKVAVYQVDGCIYLCAGCQVKDAIQEAHDSIRIERDDGGKCCVECFSVSHDVNDVAVPDGCKDEECDCHNPITLRDADGTPSTFEVKDGIIVEAK